MVRAARAVARAAGAGAATTDFGYLFPELQKDPANRLPPGNATVANLKALGKTMRDSASSSITTSRWTRVRRQSTSWRIPVSCRAPIWTD
jgi:hypothetical protein